ncbi:ABC transporter permease [Kitasatospora aureofaciens]|uniref:ABC transporter n=1 Tax=Kitasatospora aureofaciens TaxID=1894 RepID=A0A1E7N1X2_KITAU|nr:ABC transporter permease [Kitasatospora aureofaciens]QEV00142.1 FtsX-like permease family protein [Streptomyces viridifaciens]ARF78938.1 ABC transporter [Kitasatospora aureofaciens]OEV34463.1 ABC transporter [Kitasatospora aureofaciens]UKZ06338.1 ABC transporter permease [Streptomyces viridifaciens]GGU84094.1 ABC transporter [Kitasatospora aureofaciens]
MYRTALRNVLAHKGRLLMTALAVMLGTAFVAGTMVFSDTFGKALRDSNSKSYSDIAVQVVDRSAGSRASAREKSEGGSATLTDETVQQLASLPGAAGARGVAGGFTGVADKKGDLIGQVWSAKGANFAPGQDGRDPRYPMVEGQGPKNAKEIALDRRTADKAGYKVGDTVRVAANGPVIEAKLTGVFTTDDPVVNTGGTLTLFDKATAQQTLLEPGRYSSIVLTAKPGTSQDALLAQVEPKVTGHQFDVETGTKLQADEQAQITQGTDSMRTMLLVFAFISLFVGIFIIANTFTMLVAQRTRELALLRAIGASRKQVTRSVLIEALVIGVVSATAGLLAGIGIGAGMQSLIGSLNENMPNGSLVVKPLTVVATLVVGVLVTVLSALLPAMRAARIAPVAAMSSGDQPASQKSLVVRNTIGSVLAGGGLALIGYGASTGNDSGRLPVGAGAFLALIGVFVLLPLLSRPVVALVGPLLRALGGTPGKLAQQNAVRNPRRTAATAAALTIGLTLVTGLTVLGTSIGDTIDRAVTKSMKADYIVSTANGMNLSGQVPAQIAKAPGVAASSPMTAAYWKLDGTSKAISGLDAAAFEQLAEIKLTSGSADALGKGQLLVDQDVATKFNVATGSTMTATFPDGSTGPLTVGGVYEKGGMLGPVLLANSEIAKHDPKPYVADVLVRGKNGATPELKQALKDATGANPVIEVKSKQDVRDDFSQVITFALNLMYGLLGMAVLIAVLGVINTLAMSVFERKREIGMLRAIGLDRSGIKRMVRLESVVISLFGAGIGLLLGCFIAWAINGTLKSSLAGLTTVLPYGQLAVFLGLAGLVGLVAAIWPARRAAKLDILESIKTD